MENVNARTKKSTNLYNTLDLNVSFTAMISLKLPMFSQTLLCFPKLTRKLCSLCFTILESPPPTNIIYRILSVY